MNGIKYIREKSNIGTRKRKRKLRQKKQGRGNQKNKECEGICGDESYYRFLFRINGRWCTRDFLFFFADFALICGIF